MIVSIALLGTGFWKRAGCFPQIKRNSIPQVLCWSSLGAALSILASYLVVNWLPFDSFSMAWDRRQVLVLVFHFLVLATPFFFCGLAVGVLLSAFPEKASQTYAANLVAQPWAAWVALLAPARWEAKDGGAGVLISAGGGIIFLAEINPEMLVRIRNSLLTGDQT
jgi:hypothetical protein